MDKNIEFQTAFKRTVGVEGGYVDHPADKGGPTKYGISRKAFPDLDIKNLTLEQAEKIYFEKYWLPLGLDNLSSEFIKLEIFDTGVNCGKVATAKIAQRAVNFLGGVNGDLLEVDGFLGTVTLAALDFWIIKDVAAIYKALNGFQFMHYVNIIENDPGQRVFSRGWMKRIQQYREG